MNTQRSFEHEVLQARNDLKRNAAEGDKNWMGPAIWFLFAAACASMLLLGGCSGTAGVLPLDKAVTAATDRHAVWGQVETAKLQTVGKIADAEKAKAELEKTKKENITVVMTLDTNAKMFAYQLGEANKALARSNELMGRALIAKETKGSVYTAGITFFKQPEGAFAESIRTFFAGITGVARTPAAAIGAGGWATGYLAGKVGDAAQGNEFNGDVKADGSFNSSTLHQTGSASASASLAPSTTDPVIVEPAPLPEVVE